MGNVENRYEVIISEKASDMLVSHVRFLANVSEEAAGNLIANFKESANSLRWLPDRYPWISDPNIAINKYRKLLFNQRYLMIYQIKHDKVYIDYIVDCRQDYSWLI